MDQLGAAGGELDLILHRPYRPGMDRRRFLLTSLAGPLAAPLGAKPQQRRRVYRIGYVGLNQAPGGQRQPSEKTFLATLRDLGYVENTNLVMEWRYGGDSAERYAEIAAELVKLGVNAIVTVGMPAVHAVKRATNHIPIVMAVSEDPVGARLAESLARPGGNVTGFTRGVEHEVMTKGLQLMREAIPVSRVGLTVHESNRGIEKIGAVAAGLGIVLKLFEIRTMDDITSTGFFAARIPRHYQFSSRRSSNSSSTSRQPRHSASPSRRRCWRGPIR